MGEEKESLVPDLHQDGAHGAVMQAALVGVEHHRGNHQAQQQGPYDRRGNAGGTAVHFLDLKAEDPVTDAVTEQAHQEDLFHGEDGQDGKIVSTEEPVGNQGRDGPVDQQGTQARTNTGY